MANSSNSNPISEDSDPARDNSIGGLLSRAQQPFDFGTTLLHSQAERDEIERELIERIMPEARTRAMREPSRWLEVLRKHYDLAAARYHHCSKDGACAELERAEMDMLNECIAIWVQEISLFLKDLRLELAAHIEATYPYCSVDLAEALRGEER